MSVKRNPNLGPSHIRAKRRRLFWIRFYIILFLLLIIIFALAIFSGHEKVVIKNIVISGNASVSADAILAIANRDIASRYLSLFAKSNYLIFPRYQIEADILEEFKSIKGVDISWAEWQNISINIVERKPHSVWCGLSTDAEKEKQDCFLVDKEGYIYSEAPTFSGSLFIKDYGEPVEDNISVENIENGPIGKYFLSRNLYIKIFNLINILDQNNFKIVSVVYDGFDFKFKLESGPFIIFNIENDLNMPFDNFFTAIETGKLDLQSGAEQISYIDLRFENKIVIGKK